MSINDKKGINLTSGFKYVGGQPLDVRLIAEDESDLQSLVDNGATYNGMVVWVNSTSKRMVFNGSEFIEDVSPDTIGNINDVLEQINGGGTSSGGSSSGSGSVEEVNLYDIMQTFLSGNALMEISEDVITFINQITPNTKLVFKGEISEDLSVEYNYHIITYSNIWNAQVPKLSFIGKFVGNNVLIHCSYTLIEDKYYQTIEAITTGEL